MRSKMFVLALTVVFAILFSFIPIWPVWVEGGQFTRSGESLYHSWQFVSLKEFFDSYIYARAAWQESTTVAYLILFIINSLILVFFSWLAASWLRRKLLKIR